MTKRALVIIDLQNDYFPNGKFELTNIVPAAENAARLLQAARAKGEFVVHVQHVFASPEAPFFVKGTPGVEINPVVQNLEGEPVVVKHRPNSFLETDLNARLIAKGITDVVICGAMSHMCIDATARAAADLGYTVTVVHDAIATRDLEFGGVHVPAAQVQAAFLAALASSYAAIVATDEQLQR